MDRFQAFKNQVKLLSFATMMICSGIAVAGLVVANHFGGDHVLLYYIGTLVAVVVTAWWLSVISSNYVTQPMSFVWRAVLHVMPGHSEFGAPNLEQAKVAHEMVNHLVMQVYQLASTAPAATPNKQLKNPLEAITSDITHNLPLPVFAVNKDQNIIFVNEAALKYLGQDATDVLNKNLYSILDLLFSEDRTLDKWLAECRANKAKANNSWVRVRLKLGEDRIKQFDLAASYSKDDPLGMELLLTIFDQTDRYQGEDNELDFIAITVHELRTPLTSLRGYIEVFEDELAPQLNREQTEFMRKMQASAQQLTAFVGNILNVARIQEGQLSLILDKTNWASIIQTSIDSMSLSAQLHGITIQATVDPAVPEVGVDRISIVEVLNNLIDNAIKYSGTGNLITIQAFVNKDGMVETTVSDNGVGIPAAVMPTLFQKFHRNHRNLAKIGGTGLGLYLSSALVKAHGGNIWVKSKEAQGTTVGFTVQPYSLLAGKVKDRNNTDIVRNAHGWIKNHSLYRR